MKIKAPRLSSTTLIGTGLTLLFVVTIPGCDNTQKATTGTIVQARFEPDGSIHRPEGYRQWVNVGTAILPKGFVNIIDDLPLAWDEYIDTYVEPSAYAAYMRSGIWPDGSQFVKEFTALKEPDKDGIRGESHYSGLAMIVKDSTKYPAETGHLGYFHFGHQSPPYKDKSVLQPRTKCSFCHEANASNQQYVFTDRHIGLKRN